MTSEAKNISNRANAVKSCGPKTPGGKSRARYNALKFGVYAGLQLLPGEDPKAFERLRSKLAKKHEPNGPDDDFLVERLAACIWRDQRLKMAEWAALKRAEIKTELFEKAKNKEFWPSDVEVDGALRRALGRAEDQTRQPARAKAEIVDSESSSAASVVTQSTPLSFTFFKCYGSGPDGKHCEIFDQRIRANSAEVFRLQAALEASRMRRRNVEESG